MAQALSETPVLDIAEATFARGLLGGGLFARALCSGSDQDNQLKPKGKYQQYDLFSGLEPTFRGQKTPF
jgi:hypothetical protein